MLPNLYTWIDRNVASWTHLKNRIGLVRSFRGREPRVRGYPSIIYIESSNWCNFSCPMCPTTIMQRENRNMEFDTWKLTIDQLDPAYTELVCMHSDGEPLLNKNFPKMVEYAKSRGLRLYTSTNASGLTEKNARVIIDSGFDVLNLSLDAVTKDVYEIVRVGGTFEKTMSNIEKFLELKGNRKPTVLVQLIEMPENEHQVREFLEFWEPYRKQGVIPVVKKMIDWFNEIPDIIDNYNWCDRPWFGMVVQSNGDVFPCTHDFDGVYTLGNVNGEHLYELWNGDKMVALRESITRGRRTNILCKDCNYVPPVGHNAFVDAGLVFFDMCTVSKLIPRIGFRRARQYVSAKEKEAGRVLTKIKKQKHAA
jgi:radical SAM protein with 4Fe4S-binding SPASM domain